MSKPNSRDTQSTSSGHGALGMGGQPDDDPRDLESGRESLPRDERTGPVPGAKGGTYDPTTGGSAGNATVGPMGDKGITGNIGESRQSARRS